MFNLPSPEPLIDAAAVLRAEGAELARACHNAAPHLPTRGRFPWARLVVGGQVHLTATDGYTLGRAVLAVEESPVAPESLIVTAVPRAGLAELEAAGKRAGGLVEIRIRPDAVQVAPCHTGEEGALVLCPPLTEAMKDLWERCDALLDTWVTGRPALPELLAIDPALWSRFAKVKTPPRTASMVDALIVDPAEAVVCRVGPDYLGAIMPIDREVAGASEARGQAFLW